MSNILRENVTPSDLGGLTGSLPPEVLEILGTDEVAQAEAITGTLLTLKEIAGRANPFEEISSESLITSEARAAMGEIKRIDDLDDLVTPDLNDQLRRQAKTLNGHNTQTRKKLERAYKDTLELYDGIRPAGKSLAETSIDDYLRVSPGIFEVLDQIASQLPAPSAEKEYEETFRAEDRAADIDAATVLLRQDTDLRNEFYRLMRGLRAGPRGVWEAKKKEYVDFAVWLSNEGRKLRVIKKAHRSVDDIVAERIKVDDAISGIEWVRTHGHKAHEIVATRANDLSAEPAIELFELLTKMSSRNLQGQSVENTTSAAWAIMAEAYVAEKSALVEETFRRSGVKPTREARSLMHELKDTALQRRVTRLADVSISPTERPYSDIQADPAFRGECREVKDILAGGGRINHPEAKKLAGDLHRLAFNNGARLLPEESGVILAAAVGKVGSLMSVVERFESARETDDPQVEKLRFDLPDQHSSISALNIDALALTLKKILSDVHDRLALMAVLPNSINRAQFAQAIEELIRWREAKQEIDEQVELAGTIQA